MVAHAAGIVSFVATRLTNGLLEGINSKIQWIARATRGYRHTKNFKRMILFVFATIQPRLYLFPTQSNENTKVYTPRKTKKIQKSSISGTFDF
jgi:hypothetical protein